MNTGAAARHVLVAEDDPVFGQVLQFHLEAAGFTVTIAEDGNKAWELLQTQDFDLLLTDVQMAGLTGIKLSRKLRSDARYATIPIVFVTAKALEFDVPRIQRELTISHVFSKPSAPGVIVQAVRDCLTQDERS